MTIRKPIYWVVLLMGSLLALVSLSQSIWESADAQSDNPFQTTDGYVRFDDIPGQSTEVNHVGWSEVMSFQLGMFSSSFGDGAVAGKGAGAQRGKPTLEELIVVKDLDSAGTYLAQYAVNGNALAQVDLELVAPGPDGRFVYYEISLKNARVTSYSIGTTGQKDLTPARLPLVAASSNLPVEQVTLSYEKIKLTYTEQKADGSAGDSHTFEYDLKTNK